MQPAAGAPKQSKGERTVAREVGIQQPSLYRYFDSKQALYAAVLDRALTPMLDAMRGPLANASSGRGQAALAGVMTDILLEHPKMAALFQQALRGDNRSIGDRLIRRWLDRLFHQAVDLMETTRVDRVDRVDRAELAIQIIAMFNLTTGYFLAQRALESMAGGHVTDPENVARQKRLLERVVRATHTGATRR